MREQGSEFYEALRQSSSHAKADCQEKIIKIENKFEKKKGEATARLPLLTISTRLINFHTLYFSRE